MLALIIWGSTSRDKVLGQGMFGCPNCRQTTPFTHKKVQRYFTLYFIPLFPIGTIAEFVECGQCGGNFQASVLQQIPQLPQQGGWPQQGGQQQGGWPQQGGPQQGGPQQGGPQQGGPQQGVWPQEPHGGPLQGGPPQGGQGWGQ